MNIFISVGEASGDIHGANLIKRFNAINSGLQFTGMGGRLMLEAGQEQFYTVKEMAILGIWEVIKHLPFIKRVFKEFTALFARGQIDAVILVDYPGFNLRLAKIAKKYDIPVFYYICPQMWAWGRKRIFKIKKYVDHSFVIFDFEKDFFQKYGVPATYIGHPIIEAINALNPANDQIEKKNKLLALLPGSREHEIESLLPTMFSVGEAVEQKFPDWQYVIARAMEMDEKTYTSVCEGLKLEKLVTNRFYDILKSADAAIVASGTAALETAIFGVPHIITYRVNPLTWFIGKALVKLPFIGMANILSGKEIIPEFLQSDMQPEKIESALIPLLEMGSVERDKQIAEMREVTDKLNGSNASEIAVLKILEILK